MTKDTWLDGDAASTSLDAAPDVDVVTGDAVTLDFRPVTAMTRGAAYFIDAVLYGAIYIGFVVLLVNWFLHNPQVGFIVYLVAMWVVFLLAPMLIETFSGGKSLGKWVLGIRVVRDDGGPIRWQHAMLRAVMGVAELWSNVGVVALLVSVGNAQGKRVGDMLAGTMVISDRGKPLVLWRPPYQVPLRSWAVGADVDRLPARLEHQFRQLVTRHDKLSPQGWNEVAAAVVREAAPFLYPAPPVGAHPYDVMVAVLEQRMHRDFGRAQRQQQEAHRVIGRARTLPFSS